jgi:hypothetical protein
MSEIIRVVARDTGIETILKTGVGNHTVSLLQPSVVVMQLTAKDISHVDRIGDDLVLHLKNGSVVRCKNFFVVQGDQGSVLVLEDPSGALSQASFPADVLSADGVTAIEPWYEAVSSLDPYLAAGAGAAGSAGWFTPLMGGLLGAGVLAAAAGAGGGGGGGGSSGPAPLFPLPPLPPLPVDPAALPAATVAPNDGKNIHGTATPNAHVAVDVNGDGIPDYTTTVGPDGTWSVTPVQPLPDGTHVVVTVTDPGGKHPSPPVESVVDAVALPPKFTSSDNVGEVQGELANGAATDDTTPTFAGTAEPGATVTIKDTAGNVLATVVADGKGAWRITLPEQPPGNHEYVVSQTDVAGNTATAGTFVLNVSTKAPEIHIALPIAGDNIVNAAEGAAGIVVRGTVANVEDGQAVSLALAGKTYTATVANGEWSVAVGRDVLGTLADGSYAVSARVANAAGAKASDATQLSVEASAPHLSITEPLAFDGYVGIAEAASGIKIGGLATGVENGQAVTLKLGDKTYTALVTDGRWSLLVPAGDLAAMPQGLLIASATATDAAGNPARAQADLVIDTAKPGVTIEPIAGDNTINAAEMAGLTAINGSTTGAAGQPVSVGINGQNFVATSNGSNWSLTATAAVKAALADGTGRITAAVADRAGNGASASTTVTIDTSARSVSIDPVAGNNVVNSAEFPALNTLTGRITGAPGATVTVTIDGKDHAAAVSGDTWSLLLTPAIKATLTEGGHDVAVTVADAAGNTARNTGTFVVDLTVPTIAIGTVAGDDMVNAAEFAALTRIAGTTTGATDRPVTVTIDGMVFDATVSGNSWSLDVGAAVRNVLGNGSHAIRASVSDTAGNAAEASKTIGISAVVPSIHLDTVAGDDVVNAAEFAVLSAIRGTTTGAGDQPVTVSIDGQGFAATVSGNSWSLSVTPAVKALLTQGAHAIRVNVSDAAGNSVSDASTVTVNLSGLGIAIADVAADNVVNASEMAGLGAITGRTSGATGQPVTVTIDGQAFQADVNGDAWSLPVNGPVKSLLLAQGAHSIRATVDDAAGNSAAARASIEVDTDLPTIGIDTVAGDNVVNAAELASLSAITGTTTGAPGQPVNVTIDGKQFAATVTGNEWRLAVTPAIRSMLTDGQHAVVATVADASGNAASASRDLGVGATVPTIVLHAVGGDNVLNIADLAALDAITGTTTGAPGLPVSVGIGGSLFTAVVTGNSWRLEASPAVKAALADGVHTVVATVTDPAGNSATVSGSVLSDTVAPTIALPVIAMDDVVNKAELAALARLGGTTTGADGQPVTVTINGSTFAATVDGNAWSLAMTPAVKAVLQEGPNTIGVGVSDAAGNSASASRDVTLDTRSPTIAIDTVAGNDAINAEELANLGAITGTTSGASDRPVTVSIDGVGYQATVKGDSWKLAVTPAIKGALSNGEHTLTAIVSDDAGNNASADSHLVVDTAPPGIHIDIPIAGDGVINRAELGGVLAISGTTTGAAGRQVLVSIDGTSYAAEVTGNTWRLPLGADAKLALTDGSHHIVASVSDDAGNAASASTDVLVSASRMPTVSIDTVAGDNVLNAIELGALTTLSGTTAGATGQPVTVNIGGVNHDATVNGDSWSLAVTPAIKNALQQGDNAIGVSVKDSADNPATTVSHIVLDTLLPTITIDDVAGDNSLNAGELGTLAALSGHTTGATDRPVVVGINGTSYNAIVTGDNWSLPLTQAIKDTLKQGGNGIVASVKDAAGNSALVVGSVELDSAAPTIGIHLVAGDDVVNAAELASLSAITGSTTGASGRPVAVTIDGQRFDAAVNGDSWTLDVNSGVRAALAAEGSRTIVATVADAAGNTATASKPVSVDTTAPTVTIDGPVAGDNVVNTGELATLAGFSGKTTGASGQPVSVQVNGKSFAATVVGDTWTLAASDAVKAALAEGPANSIVASVKDAAGNGATSDDTRLTLDTQAPGIAIGAIAGDNIVNTGELAGLLTISGTTTGASGQPVTVSIGGTGLSATVTGDSWSVTVPDSLKSTLGNGSYKVIASVGDNHGNAASSATSFLVALGAPTIAIHDIAGSDGLLSADELAGLATIGGTTTGADGQPVTVNIGGVNYNATVSGGNWSLVVDDALRNAFGQGNNAIGASVKDSAGNSASANAQVSVDTIAPTIAIADFSGGDNLLGKAELAALTAIEGTTSGTADRPVSVTIGGIDYKARVDGSSWSLALTSAMKQALSVDGLQTVRAGVSDLAGNAASAERSATVDTTGPAITIADIAGDNAISSAELAALGSLTGTTSGANGQAVNVLIDGTAHAATVSGNTWSLALDATMKAALTEGGHTIVATVADAAGNAATASKPVSVDTSAPTIAMADFTGGDNRLGATELGNLDALGGSTTGAADRPVTVSIDGQDHAASVTGNSWTLALTPAIKSLFADGGHTVVATVADAAGNGASNSRGVTVDTGAPTIGIDDFSNGDKLLNAAELAALGSLTGTTTGSDGQPVTVTINNSSFSATVNGDSWTLAVTPAVKAALAEGANTVSASVRDMAGNTASASLGVVLDSQAPTITIGTVAGDDTVNTTEMATWSVIGGTTTGAAGRPVTVTIDGQDHNATVTGNSWTLDVSTLKGTLAQGSHAIGAKVSDAAGNAAAASRSLQIDTQAPTIAIADFTGGDGALNARELAALTEIRGTTTGADGQSVTVTIGVSSFDAVASGGTWVLTLTPQIKALLAGNGSHTVLATVHDAAGNTASDSTAVTVNTALPTIAIDAVAGDDLINAIEMGRLTEITGTTSGATGRPVKVMVNGVAHEAVVSGDRWSLPVDSDIKNYLLTQGRKPFVATVDDGIGNTATANAGVLVDTLSPSIAITAPVAADANGDAIVNAVEFVNLNTLSGTTTDAGGRPVTVTIDGVAYTGAVVTGDSWTLDIAAIKRSVFTDGNHTVVASVVDAAGNTAASNTVSLYVDGTAPAITLQDFTGGDATLGATEKAALVELRGTTTDAAGLPVTVAIGGHQFKAAVNGNTWTLPVGTMDSTGSVSVAGALANGSSYSVVASVRDAAGNSATATQAVAVDTTAPGIAITAIGGDSNNDGTLNAAEYAGTITIGGTTSGATGRPVTVTVGGIGYTAAVSGDSWSLTLDSAAKAALGQGSKAIVATVSDSAGNSASTAGNIAIDTAAPTIAIKTPHAGDANGDGVFNIAEIGHLAIAGTTTAEAGRTVTVTVNGAATAFTATVQGDGSWSIADPALNALLKQGGNTLAASVTDAAGNAASTTTTLDVDTVAPALAINDIAGDNVVNAAELATLAAIGGTATGANGRTVTVHINGQDFSTTVSSGTWSLAATTAVKAALGSTQGAIDITADVADVAGNPAAQATKPVTVDTVYPAVAFDAIAGDNVVNSAEMATLGQITGTATGVAGRTVSVAVDGSGSYTAVVAGNGTWAIDLADPANAGLKAALKTGQGNHRLSASVSDAAGNPATGDTSVVVDSVSPTITIGTPVDNAANGGNGDNIVNIAELDSFSALRGTVANAGGSPVVQVTIEGKVFAASVSGNAWSVAAGALASDGSSTLKSVLTNGTHAIVASTTDDAGNAASASGSVFVDFVPPAIVIDDFAGSDNVLSRAEMFDASGKPALVITGSTTGAGAQEVTVSIGTYQFIAAVNSGDNTWSLAAADHPLLFTALSEGGPHTVLASVRDAAGNPASATRSVTIDGTPPVVTIDAVATDDKINGLEYAGVITVSGTATGAENGQSVTLAIGARSFNASVTDGKWSLSSATTAGLKAAFAQGSNQLSANIDDLAGNAAATANRTVLLKTNASTIAITTPLDAAGDGNGTFNSVELTALASLKGDTSAEDGQTVTVSINGTAFTTTASAGHWSLPASAAVKAAFVQGGNTVTASVQDQVGNSASASAAVNVDTQPPAIAIGTPYAGDSNADNVINIAELNGLGIAGTSTAEAGRTVTVSLNGSATTFGATVRTDGSWSITDPALQGLLKQGANTVAASVADAAGNAASTTATLNVDTVAPTVVINDIGGDNTVSAAELAALTAITGTAGGAAGSTVTVHINGQDFSTTVNSGSWSLAVDAAVRTALGKSQGAIDITADVADAAGNPAAQATRPVTIDTVLPTVAFDLVAGDNVINGAEMAALGRITGTTTGSAVSVSVDGSGSYTAVVAADGTWAIDLGLPANTGLKTALQASQGSHALSATASDTAGNTAIGKASVLVDTDLPTLAIATPLDTTANGNAGNGDSVINIAELDSFNTLRGSVANAGGNPVVQVAVDGKVYKATVNGNAWSVSAGTLADDGTSTLKSLLTSGTHAVVASTADEAGNPASASTSVSVALTAPGIVINDFAGGDSLLSRAEMYDANGKPSLVITGSTTGANAQDVTVTIGTQKFAATVDSSTNTWSLSAAGNPQLFTALSEGGPHTVQASVRDTAGNPASATRSVTVHTSAPSVSIDTVSADDRISGAEYAGVVTLGGKTTGAEDGQLVTVMVGSTRFDATVAAGMWSLSSNTTAGLKAAFAEGSNALSANVRDVAGNPAPTASRSVVLDTTAPTIAITTPLDSAGDGNGTFNAAEFTALASLKGDTSAEDGQAVTVSVNGTAFTTTASGGHWTLPTSAAVKAALVQGSNTITATVLDVAGNSPLAPASATVNVDTAAPTVAIDTGIAGDDRIGNAEKSAVVLSGTTSAEAGQVVAVVVADSAGKKVATSATVAANGTWTTTPQDLGSLADGKLTVTANVKDVAGNAAPQATASPAMDTSAPTLAIDAGIAGDDRISNTEKGAVVLSGTTSAEAGQEVSVVVTDAGGTSVTASATVAAGGTWTTRALDLGGLADGKLTVTADVKDVAGNPAIEATASPVKNTAAPTLAIAAGIAGDDRIGNAEKSAVAISGTTSAESGQVVAVVVTDTAGKKVSTTATVGKDGTWTTAPQDLGSLADGKLAVTADVKDLAGNPATEATASPVKDTGAPTLAIAAGNAEKSAVAISGTTSAEAGRSVAIVITDTAGKSVATTATVAADGTWTTAPQDLGSLADGKLTVTADVKDLAGNPAIKATASPAKDTSAPTLAIAAGIAGDDRIGNAEKGAVVVSGTTSAEAGQQVSVVVTDAGGKSVTASATVAAGGTWSTQALDLGGLADGKLAVTADVKDLAGNPAIEATASPVKSTVAPTLGIDAGIAGDDRIGNAEKSTVVIGGTSNVEAGQAVAVVVTDSAGKKVSTTATVAADGTWKTAPQDLGALADGKLTVTADVKDLAGNPATEATASPAKDTAAPTLAITGPVAGDDRISNAEKGAVVLGGTTSAEAGQVVAVVVTDSSGKSVTTTATVAANGTWSTTPQDLGGLADGKLTVKADVKDLAGNPAVGATASPVKTTGVPVIAFDAVVGDANGAPAGVINIAEMAASTKLTGTTTGVENGQVATVTIGSFSFASDKVAGNAWSLSMTALSGTDGKTTVRQALSAVAGNEGNVVLTAQVNDLAGNPSTVANASVAVDLLRPTIDIATPLSGDGVVNAAEQGSVTIGGTSTNAAGLTLTLVVGDGTAARNVTQQVTVGSDGSWSASGLDLSRLNNGTITATAAVTDAAGNAATNAGRIATANHDNVVAAMPGITAITVDSVDATTGSTATAGTGADFITSDTTLDFAGSLAAPLAADETLQVRLLDGTGAPVSGFDWTVVTTTTATGWTFNNTANTLAQGAYTVQARVVDKAGNIGAAASHAVTVDTAITATAPTFTSVSADTGDSASDFFTSAKVDKNTPPTPDTNADDTVQPLVFSGSTGGALQADERVQLSFDNGKTWADATTQPTAGGSTWSYTDKAGTPGVDATGIRAEGSYQLVARLIDTAGNVTPATVAAQTLVVDRTAPTQTTTFVLSVDTAGAAPTATPGVTLIDTAVNTDLVTRDTTPTLSGVLSAALAATDALVLSYSKDAGKNWSAWTSIVPIGTAWSYTPPDAYTADTTVQYRLQVRDQAGNVGVSLAKTATFDVTAPTQSLLRPTLLAAQDTGALGDGITTTTTLTFASTGNRAAQAGATVALVQDTNRNGSYDEGVDTVLGSVVADGTGAWSLSSGLLAQGNYALGLMQWDAAGNRSRLSATTGIGIVATDGQTATTQAIAGSSTENIGQGAGESLALGTNGLWTFFGSSTMYSQATNLTSFTPKPLMQDGRDWTYAVSFADFDRDGLVDLVGSNDNPVDTTIFVWKGSSNWSRVNYSLDQNPSTGPMVAFDKEGDGYVDYYAGNGQYTPGAMAFINNKAGVWSNASNKGHGTVYPSLGSGDAGSGVDIDNDGDVDIVAETNGVWTGTAVESKTSITVMTNNGTGDFTAVQNIGSVTPAAMSAMTWADFNGDGDLDLFLSSGTVPGGTATTNVSRIYYNTGSGRLQPTPQYLEDASKPALAKAGTASLAVDWNHDGAMDIAEFSSSTPSVVQLYTNDGAGSAFVSTTVWTGAGTATPRGAVALDYDWDGAVDLGMAMATNLTGGGLTLIRNTNVVAPGTALHLRILDDKGFNTFYGNTVQLRDTVGKVVATQVLNAQSGQGSNDGSGLLHFYGLVPGQTYTATLLRNVSGTAANASWTVSTEAGDSSGAYVLTAPTAAAAASLAIDIVGTGYSDTFVATAGSHSYNGSGGWSPTMAGVASTWSATGGMDVIDYGKATAAVSVNLGAVGSTTGWATDTLKNIEGVRGGSQGDTFVGNAADNIFEGRGGNDSYTLGGGHDVLVYKPQAGAGADGTGGNGADTVTDFTLGSLKTVASADVIDLRGLLSGYTGTAYVFNDGAAGADAWKLDTASAGLNNYLKVVVSGSDTLVQVDPAGKGSWSTVLTLTGVQTDLPTLLANDQLWVNSTSTVMIDALATADTTPLVTGTMQVPLAAVSALEVTINGKTYSSATGAVEVDAASGNWVLQVPAADALPGGTYDVLAVVNNGGNLPAQDRTSKELTVVPLAAVRTVVGESADIVGIGMTVGDVNGDGLLDYFNGNAVYTQAATSAGNLAAFQGTVLFTPSNTYNGVNKITSVAFVDYNGDGKQNALMSQNAYDGGDVYFKNNSAGGATSFTQVTMPRGMWDLNGAIAVLDLDNDGRLDVVYGDGSLDDGQYWLNKGSDWVVYSTSTTPSRVTNGVYASPLTTTRYSLSGDVAAFDMNADGRVDLLAGNGVVQGAATMYDLSIRLSGLTGQSPSGVISPLAGTPTQILKGVLNESANGTVGFTAGVQSLAVADYNGDGNLDLFLGQSNIGADANAKRASRLYTGDSKGTLTASTVLTDVVAGGAVLPADWNMDGKLDAFEFKDNGTPSATVAINPDFLYWQNTTAGAGAAPTFTSTTMSVSSVATAKTALGAVSADFDWDGKRDLVVNTQGADVFMQNTNALATGTSLHVKLLNQAGNNTFVSQTVQLFDQKGTLVETRVLNPNYGLGTNDSTAIVDFYGLNANDTYTVKLLKVAAPGDTINGGYGSITGDNTLAPGDVVNASWTGLKTGDNVHGYVLTAENPNDPNAANIVGTGYNDTLMATAGTDTYNGSGGWAVGSAADGQWSATGGQDVIDFKLSSVAVTVDLGKAGAQATGYNTATLVNIEGVAGTGLADTLTGGTGSDLIEGRGGNDTLNLASGGHDTLLYKLLASASASNDGGNGSDMVNGFTLGAYMFSPNADRIDVHDLLVGYTPTSVAGDYLKVAVVNGNTEITLDRDGTGTAYAPSTLLTLVGVQTDLATLLANHQIVL